VFNACNSLPSLVVQLHNAWTELRGMGARRRFCKDHFVSFEAMESIDDLRSDYRSVCAC
jgi:hypothetical protein